MAEHKWKRNVWTGNEVERVAPGANIVRCSGLYKAEWWGDYSTSYPQTGPWHTSYSLASADLRKLMQGTRKVSGKPVDAPPASPVDGLGPMHHYAGPGRVDEPAPSTTCGILRSVGVRCTTAARLVTCAKCRERLVKAAGGPGGPGRRRPAAGGRRPAARGAKKSEK